jgi:hypothetical protein
MAPDTTFNSNATFPAMGNVENQGTPSVLYIEDGPAVAGCPMKPSGGCMATTRPAGNGMFFAFGALGSTPNVFAFDETTGLQVWSAHVLTGADGIRGTPVVDPAARLLYIVTGGTPHVDHAVSVSNGAEVSGGGWPVTLSNSTVTYNGTGFNSGAQNQHGALLLVNNILYIPFGGQYGDGGNYLGWLIAVNVANPTQIAGWATQSARSGIWGSGGLASDGTGIFAVTGDTTSTPRTMSDSQEVVRLTGMAAFTRNAANVFVPTESMGWDRPAADLDYGASTPAYAPLPAGSNPSGVLVSPAKAGRLFILNGPNLSGGVYDANNTPGGAMADIVVSGVTGETVYTSPTIYTSASGLHATINVGGGANATACPVPPAGQEVVVSTVIPANPANSKIAWCTANGSGGGHMNYPPISTTSDGVSANAMVWVISGSQLLGLNGDTGAQVVLTSGAACNGVPSMSYPIAVKNRIVVWAIGHLCSWSPGGV